MSGDLLTSAATLAAADPRTCDRAALTELVQVALEVRSRLDAFDADLALRAGQLAEPAAGLLTGGGRRRSRDAEAVVGRAAVLEAMPDLHDALSTGEVSAGHVDAVARAADRLEPHERSALVELAPALVDAASSTSVEAFERETRKLVQLLSTDPSPTSPSVVSVEDGDRMLLPCRGGPSIGRAERYPPRMEIPVEGGMYVLVDDGPVEHWSYDFVPADPR